MEKTFKPERKAPPFGVGSERFLSLGYHPNFETRPGTFKYCNVFPGRYNWATPNKIVSKVPSWKRELEIREFSRRLGYKGDDLVEQRLWVKSINGPGWADIKPESGKAMSFAKAKRFQDEKSKDFIVPGPGTYGKNHVPYYRIEERSLCKGFSFSLIPPFEQISCARKDTNVFLPYHLPPNIYKIKGSVDELISKKVSKRGPYDLFSGERFPEKPMENVILLPWRIYPNHWSHPNNRFKGKFLKCGKDHAITTRISLMAPVLSKKNPLEPGPSTYTPYPPPKVTQLKYPFNISEPEVRPKIKCTLHPAPGRYNPNYKRRIKGDGFRSAFVSKSKRTMPSIMKYSWFH